ncbi:hypothetical protein B566_EDAN007515 [Ephemera danica]|nr:hypothetical protein B566_EDAN007515 [Ephemera danica]
MCPFSPKKHETVTWQSPKKSLGPVAEQQSPEKNDKEWSPNKTATQQSPKKNTSSKPDLDKIKLLKASREDGSSAELRESKKSKCSVETSVERSDVKSKFASKLQVFSKPEAKKLTLVEDDADSEKVPESVNESMEHFRDEPDSKEETRVAENQMLAPPSTDKPTEISEELPCPICNKHAGKNRRAHMKSCAVKNYVSTKQLLQAIELQERQAAERRALGLPPSGLQANQKVFVKKKSSSRGACKDAGVELALVLSRSLQEAQEQEELRRVRELIGEQEAFGWQATASQAEMVANTIAPEPQPSTSGAQLLLGPGTDGVVQLSRGSANTARRGRGRNVAGPPPLLLTTKDEERERRITEKVAMLLVGDENSPTSDPAERLPKPPLSSRLKKLQNETTALWSLTSVSPSKKREAFYVTNISEFVSPTKHEPGAALRHLSQIPGRNKTPVSPTLDLCLHATDTRTCSHPQSKTCEASDMSLCSFVETNAWVASMDTAPTSPDKCRSGGNALSSAWRGLLNSRTMSDVTVYTRGEHALRAHKLVLYARCPAMLEDIAKELSPGSDRVREQMLLWSDVSRAAALAMLEFVYCDTTERATTLLQEDLEQLTQLARRYRVKELLQHLLMLTKIRTCVGAKEAESPSRNNKFATFPKPLSSPSLTPKKSPGSTSSDSVLRPRSDSPDLFTEGVQEESSVVEYERPDLEYLVSMMEKSQVDVASVQSIKSSLSSPRSVEAKRKCSSSPSVYATSSKKHCKEACRKKLSLEPDEGNQSFHMHVEPSSSQILDLLEKSPSRKFNATMDSEVETFRTAETDEGSPIISDVWDGFDDYGFEPLMPPRLSEARKSLMLAKSPDTVISISSTTVSQNSISPGNVTVRERILDDSLDAFEGIDLSGLERAALTAYAKMVSPLPSSPPPVATPVNQRPPSRQENAITPMADYSIMESPALERELDKYGIRRLRRNQAKLILRHIYNELHPLVPATPAINSHVSPVSRRGKARAPRARGRRGGTTVSREDRGRKVHDMSLSQPDPARDDDRERTHAHNTSLSQPLADSRSSGSDSSASSSDDSGEDEDGLSDLDDDGLDRPGKLETAEEVKETMSRLIVSEPELHHRLLIASHSAPLDHQEYAGKAPREEREVLARLPSEGPGEGGPRYGLEIPSRDPHFARQNSQLFLSNSLVEAALKKVQQNTLRGRLVQLSTDKAPRRRRSKHSHPNSNFTCHQCGRGFWGRTPYVQHLRSCSPAPPGACPLCSKILSSPQKLRDHLRFVHGKSEEQVYLPCSLCGKKCRSRASLEKHLIIKHSTASSFPLAGPFKCDVCKLEFTGKQLLRQHLSKFHIEQSNGGTNSPQLGDGAKTDIATLVQKVIEPSGPPVLAYSCPHCLTLHANKDRFKKHLGFILPSAFHLHEMTVDPQVLARQKEPVNCDVCGTRAANLAFLHTHQAGHSELHRPHRCTNGNCSRRFLFRCQLDRHALIHQVGASAKLLGGEPRSPVELHQGRYKCTLCKKQTRCQARLLAHIASCHQGSGEFRCNICNICFTNSKNLERHCIKKQHNGRDLASPSASEPWLAPEAPPTQSFSAMNPTTPSVNPESLGSSDSVSTSDAFSMYFQSLSSLDMALDFDGTPDAFDSVLCSEDKNFSSLCEAPQLLHGRPAVTEVTEVNSQDSELGHELQFHTLQTVPLEPLAELESSYLQNIKVEPLAQVVTSEPMEIEPTPQVNNTYHMPEPCVATTVQTQTKHRVEEPHELAEQEKKVPSPNVHTSHSGNPPEQRNSVATTVTSSFIVVQKLLPVVSGVEKAPQRQEVTEATHIDLIIDSVIKNPVVCDGANKSSSEVTNNAATCDSSASSDALSALEAVRKVKHRSGSCRDCGKVFSSAHSAARHNKLSCPGRQLTFSETKCPKCIVTLPNRKDLLKHQRELHPETLFTCSACNKGFLLAQSLARHQKESCNRRESFNCRPCKISLSCQEDWKSHIAEVHGTYSECEICGKSLATPQSLKRHMRGHKHDSGMSEAEESLPAPHSDTDGSIPVQRRKQQCAFQGEQVLSQGVCGGEYGTNPILNGNGDSDNLPEEFNLSDMFLIKNGALQCDFCEASFPSDKLLLRHLSSQHFPNTQWQPAHNASASQL